MRFPLIRSCNSLLVGIAAITAAPFVNLPGAMAADAGNGKTLYNTAMGGVACSASICHGPSPAANLNSTMKGANNPAAISSAIAANAGGTMGAAVKFSAAQLADIAAYIANPVAATPIPTPGTSQVIEYFHAGFGHYFITASPGESAAIDAGTIKGWTRTGETFKVFPVNTAGSSNVCRFFTEAFAPKSSHFYTPSAAECAGVKTNPVWQYEDLVFSITAASAGTCSFGMTPLYRLYNDGKSGAPNHRYTVSTSIHAAMLAQGWVSEGVIACVPM